MLFSLNQQVILIHNSNSLHCYCTGITCSYWQENETRESPSQRSRHSSVECLKVGSSVVNAACLQLCTDMEEAIS